MSRATQVAWAAGFIDGEASIGIARRKAGRSHVLRMSVSQVNPEPLQVLLSLFGGSVSARPSYGKNQRPYWFWAIEGRKARMALEELAPHVVGKRREVAIALAFQRGIPNWGNRYHGPDARELARREEARMALMAEHGRSYARIDRGGQ